MPAALKMEASSALCACGAHSVEGESSAERTHMRRERLKIKCGSAPCARAGAAQRADTCVGDTCVGAAQQWQRARTVCQGESSASADTCVGDTCVGGGSSIGSARAPCARARAAQRADTCVGDTCVGGGSAKAQRAHRVPGREQRERGGVGGVPGLERRERLKIRYGSAPCARVRAGRARTRRRGARPGARRPA